MKESEIGRGKEQMTKSKLVLFEDDEVQTQMGSFICAGFSDVREHGATTARLIRIDGLTDKHVAILILHMLDILSQIGNELRSNMVSSNE